MASKINYRQQNDGKFEELSEATAISTPLEENQTRSEFKDESDINILIGRYGALPPGRGVQYGVVNFDDDLTTAYEKVERAREAYEHLPPAVRKLYPDWQSLADAIAIGEQNPALGDELDEYVKKANAEARKAERAQQRAEEAEAAKAGEAASAPASEARQ